MAKISGKMRKSIGLYLAAYERLSPEFNPFRDCMAAKIARRDWGASADKCFAEIDGEGADIVACLPRDADRLFGILCGQALLDRQIKDWAGGYAEGVTPIAELRADFPDFPDRVWRAVVNQGRRIWRQERDQGRSLPWIPHAVQVLAAT